MLLRYIAPLLVACALLTPACTEPALHEPVSTVSLPPVTASPPRDRSVLAGEWEYEDADIYGAILPLVLDQQGTGHYKWKEGRFETYSLIGRTWQGKWFQNENDRDGGFTVEFSQDFSKGQGRWWYSRIGTDYAPTQKGGAFILTKKAVPDDSEIP